MGIRTVKINGKDANPSRWPDGSYSVQGTASVLGITPQTVFHWLHKGRLTGRQLSKGQPWQISLSDTQIALLKTQVRRTTHQEWRHHEVLGSERLTGALLDRLTHHVH